MLKIYKKRAEYILKQAQANGYDPDFAKRDIVISLIAEAFVLTGGFALAIGDRLIIYSSFWLWIAGLIALSCLATISFILLSGRKILLYLAFIVYLGAGVFFILSMPQKELIPELKTIYLFFLAFIVGGGILMNVIDYTILRKHKELPLKHIKSAFEREESRFLSHRRF
jgi:hypothetical protein